MKKTVVLVTAIFALLILGCVLPSEVVQKEKPEPAPVASVETDDEEKEKLKEKIAELEKQKLEDKIKELEKKVDEQKDNKSTTEKPKSTPVTKRPPKGFARVNSPGDGFLALRSEPSVNRGVRVNKIPHGKTIRIYECGGVTTVSGRRGRWCQVVYRRDIGWVFDAYLIR